MPRFKHMFIFFMGEIMTTENTKPEETIHISLSMNTMGNLISTTAVLNVKNGEVKNIVPVDNLDFDNFDDISIFIKHGALTKAYDAYIGEGGKIRISENDLLTARTYENLEVMAISTDDNYCNICCMETTFDEQNNCEVCGNPKSAELSEKDDEIQNISEKSKNMVFALSNCGFTQEQINKICDGSLGMLRAWIDVDNSIEEIDYIINVVVYDIVTTDDLSEVHDYNLGTEEKAEKFVEKINSSMLFALNDAVSVFDEIKGDDEDYIVLR